MFLLVLLLAFLGGGRGLDQDEYGLQNLQDMYDYEANDFDYAEVPVQKRQLTNDDNLMRVPDIDPEEHRLGIVDDADKEAEMEEEKEKREAKEIDDEEEKTSSHYVIHPPPGAHFNAELRHPSNPNVVHQLGFETPKTKSTVIHVHHPDSPHVHDKPKIISIPMDDDPSPPVVHVHHKAKIISIPMDDPNPFPPVVHVHHKPKVISIPMDDDPKPEVIHVHHHTAPRVIHVAQPPPVIHVAQPPPVNVFHVKSNNRLRELRTRQMFVQFLKQMDAQQRLDFMAQLRAASAGNRNQFRALLNQIVLAANTRISQMGAATLEAQEDMTRENDREHAQLSKELKNLRQASRAQASQYREELGKTRHEVEKMRTEQQDLADEYSRKLQNLKHGMMNALEESHRIADKERKDLEARQNKLARKHRKLKKETRECPKCGCGRKCRVATRRVVRCSTCESPTCKKFCPQMPKQIPRKNYDCNKCDNQRCTSMCEAAAEYKSDMLVLRGILRRYTVAWKKRSAKNRKAIIAHLSEKLDFYIKKFRDRLGSIKGTYERKTDVQLLLEAQNAKKKMLQHQSAEDDYNDHGKKETHDYMEHGYDPEHHEDYYRGEKGAEDEEDADEDEYNKREGKRLEHEDDYNDPEGKTDFEKYGDSEDDYKEPEEGKKDHDSDSEEDDYRDPARRGKITLSLKSVFSLWRKRSGRRLDQVLLKASLKSRDEVEDIFQKYMDRAEGSFDKWKAGVTELIKYLRTVTKVWMKKAHEAIAAEAKKAAEAQIKKEQKEDESDPEEPKKEEKKEESENEEDEKPEKDEEDEKPEAVSQAGPEPQQQQSHPLQWQGKEPYAETVYKAFRRKSQAFLKIHYPRMSDATRPRVMKYVDGVFTYARQKYLDYLSRNYPIGSRYARRRKFLDFLKKVSRAIKRAATRGIRGGVPGLDEDTPKLGGSYVDRVYRGWRRRSSTFLQDGRGRVGCPDRVRDSAEPFFARARDRYAECSRSPSPEVNRQFLQFLTQLSRKMRRMMKGLYTGCSGGGSDEFGGGERGGVTGQYRDWMEKSKILMRRHVHRISRDRCGRTRQRLARRWRRIKDKAKRLHMDALKSRVSGDGRSDRESRRFTDALERLTVRLTSAVDRANDRCGRESEDRDYDSRDRDSRSDSRQDDYRGDSSDSEEPRDRKKHMYGFTLGWDKSKQGEPSVGLGIQTIGKRGGKWEISNPDFESDRDFKKNSYDIGVSFGHHDTAVAEPPPN